MEDGLGSPVWADNGAALRWLEVRGLPAPLDAYYGHPRALRDHSASQWAMASGYVRDGHQIRWDLLRGLGVPPISGARVQARRIAGAARNRAA